LVPDRVSNLQLAGIEPALLFANLIGEEAPHGNREHSHRGNYPLAASRSGRGGGGDRVGAWLGADREAGPVPPRRTEASVRRAAARRLGWPGIF